MNLASRLLNLLRSSLAAQLVLAVVLTHTVLIGLLVWDLLDREREVLVEQRTGRAEGIANMLAASGSPWVLSEDSAALNQLVASASAMKQVRYSMFVDLSGRVLAHTQPRLAGMYLADPRSRALEAGPHGVRVVAQTADLIDVAAPVLSDGKTIGWARAGVDLSDLERNRREQMMRGLGFGGAAILLGLFISLFTAKRVTRRLENLAAVSERFRLGERDVRVLTEGRDEVAAAAEGVNAMLDTVAASERSLAEAQRVAQLGNWLYQSERAEFNCSDELYRIFGFNPADTAFSFAEFLDMMPFEQRAAIEGLASDGTEGEGTTFTFTVNSDGHNRTYWSETHVDTCSGSEGRNLVGVCQDITDREAAAAQLRQAQKMEAVGQLTGGIAHDFNNLLAIIIGNLDILDEGCDAQSSRECVSEALGAALRGSELTRQLLVFSRRQSLSPQPVDLNALVAGMVTLWRRTIGEAVEVQLELADHLWITQADPAQVESAVLNLVINARDAMPDGGVLTVETSNMRVDADETAPDPDIKPGDYCVIAVSDTGCGMAPEVAMQAFEPFFTTKSEGRGSGLGLSMVYGFARQSGGEVRIYSEQGHGTVVRLYLPRAVAGAVMNETRPGTPESFQGSGETVLLVEDNDAVRRVTLHQLEGLGYRVLTAADGPEALDILRDQPGVDLLLTDVIMPGGLNGFELSRRALIERPGLRVLHISGFTHGALKQKAPVPAESLLSKPFRKEELARRLRQIFDTPLARIAS